MEPHPEPAGTSVSAVDDGPSATRLERVAEWLHRWDKLHADATPWADLDDANRAAFYDGARQILDVIVPEATCSRCLGPNIVWSAPSPLWNEVVRGGSINGIEEYGVLCPICFAVMAERKGIASLWRMYAERVYVELELVTPSGRVWNADRWMFDDPIDDTVSHLVDLGDGPTEAELAIAERDEARAETVDTRSEVERLSHALRVMGQSWDEARAALRRVERDRDTLHASHEAALAELDEARAEVERLRLQPPVPDGGVGMTGHLLEVRKHDRIHGDTAVVLLRCPDCDLVFNGRIAPSRSADHLIASVTLAHQVQSGTVPCCEMHNRHCEPPSELCCRWCSEAAHDSFPFRHADSSRCVLDGGTDG